MIFIRFLYLEEKILFERNICKKTIKKLLEKKEKKLH